MNVGEILGIIAGTLIPAITTAVVTIINTNRSKTCDNPKCCITGRKLKNRRKVNGKPKG